MNFKISFVILFSPFTLLLACINGSHREELAIVSSPGKQVVVEAESFIDSSNEFNVQMIDNKTTTIELGMGGWLAFDVEIPIAGRYQVSIDYSTPSGQTMSFWVEDYYENTDDRVYDITGKIEAPSSNSVQNVKSVGVDGSPLNVGIHPMKLHFDGQKAYVDKVTFTLLATHRYSPTKFTQSTEGNHWVQVWADEFETAEIDTSRWTFDIGNWGWGNNELQYYTKNRIENARIENGNLIIEARKGDLGEKWTSARLTTRGKVSFLYGKIELRAKVPAKKGNWAAGWTLGDEYVDELSWPYCGEIDIMESVGYEMDNTTGNGLVHATVHTPAYYFKRNNQISGSKPVINMTTEYHIYSIEWSPKEIKGSVDGEYYYVYNKHGNDMEWPFDKPQNIILNLAMGGGWGGAKGMDEKCMSQKVIVDYVRVYELQN